MNTTRRLTWLSYIIFLLLGCVFISQGVVIISVSKTYDINIANVGYLYFITVAAQALTTYGNGYLLDKINIKYELFVGLGAVLISFLCIISGWLPLFIIGLIPMGFGYGILISIPNYILLSLHPKTKFQKLNYLNFFYSLGGILGPLVLGQLLTMHYPWQTAVLFSCIVILLISFFIMKIHFSYMKNDIKTTESSEATKVEQTRWNYSVYLISAAMLFYVLSEFVFSTWIVSYLKISRNFSIGEASMGLTIYWVFITFGRFAADKIGKKMKIYQFILGSSLLAFVAYIFLFFTSSTTMIFVMIAIMGTGYAALYAAILSYGMDQLSFNSPKLMSLLVLSGTIGVILALPISSFFVHNFGFLTALLVGLVFLGLVIVSIYITLRDKTNPAIEYKKHRLWGAITKRTKVFVRRKTELH